MHNLPNSPPSQTIQISENDTTQIATQAGNCLSALRRPVTFSLDCKKLLYLIYIEISDKFRQKILYLTTHIVGHCFKRTS